MADEPIDINKARVREEKEQDIREFIASSYSKILDTYHTVSLRTLDIQKDVTELHIHIEELLNVLHDKYPELIPEEDIDENS